MKKVILIAMLAGSALMCSCAEEKKVEPVRLSAGFETQLTYEQNNVTFIADMLRQEDGSWSFTFSEPKTIEGLTFTQTDKVITVSMGDISYLADQAQIADTSSVKLIAAAADKLVSGKGLKADSKKNGVTEMSGKVGDLDFAAGIKKGKLTSLKIGNELSVKFK